MTTRPISWIAAAIFIHATAFAGSLIEVPYLCGQADGESDTKELDTLTKWAGTRPLLWLKASSLNCLVDGTPVPAWPDLSGNGFHFTQPGGRDQAPVFRSSAHGKPMSIEFDGKNDSLSNSQVTIPKLAFDYIADTRRLEGLTVLIAARIDGSAGLPYNHVVFSMTEKNAQLQVTDQLFYAYTSPQSHFSIPFQESLIGSITILGSQYKPDFEDPSATYFMSFLNDAAVFRPSAGGIPIPNPMHPGAPGATLGNEPGTQAFLKGGIYEVLVVPRAMNPGSTTELRRLLNRKYGAY